MVPAGDVPRAVRARRQALRAALRPLYLKIAGDERMNMERKRIPPSRMNLTYNEITTLNPYLRSVGHADAHMR